MFFKQNEGLLDRLVRFLAALAFIFLAALYLSGWLSIVFCIAAVILLITAATGFCGLYTIFGISTKK